MIIAKSQPFTKEEIVKLKEQFDTYIKTVIDINKKICSAGSNRHFESEEILLSTLGQMMIISVMRFKMKK